jgi:transcriptional regulator with XRE-family HTH domain/tetratricopeptide (TPR) repeat protein
VDVAAHSVGQLVRRLRQRAGLTQEVLAARAGLSVRAIRNVENNRISRPHRSTLELLAAQLAMSDEEAKLLLDDGSGLTLPADVPAQLPTAHAGFVDRVREQTATLAALRDTTADGPVVVLVHGPAGVGKTAFALRVGHAAVAGFPGGTLHADLRGASRSPTDPHRVLAGWCQALGISPDAVPQDPAERAAYFRSVLASRRVLLVCDDALNAAQLTPLLPGTPGSAVVATSRWALAMPAVTLDVPLDLLDDADACAVVRTALAGRADSDDAAIKQIVGVCGRLPLALRIAAGRLALHPSWTVDAYARMLDHSRDRLDQLRLGDSSVQASLEDSYRAIGDRPDGVVLQRIFDRVAVHEGPSLSLEAIAYAAEVPPGDCDRMLDVLCQAHLLRSPAPQRYAMHDLLRAYGRGHLDVAELRRTTARLLDYYMARALGPTAADWYAQDRDNVVAAVTAAAAVDPPAAAVLGRLLEACGDHFEVNQDERAWRIVAEATLGAAEAVGDEQAQATAHDALALIARLDLRLGDAERHCSDCLRLYGRTGSERYVARAWNRLGNVHTLQGRHGEAARCYSRSLSLRRRDGDLLGQASVLNNLGLSRQYQGDLARAQRCFLEAGALYQRLGDLRGGAITSLNLGGVYRMTGRLRLAVATQRQAIALAERAGSRSSASHALCGFADTVLDAGHPGLAIGLYERVLATLSSSGDRDLRSTAAAGLARARGHAAAGLGTTSAT